MPFRDFPEIDLATVAIMRTAYDAAVLRLNLTPTDPMSGKLALKIVALTKAGERDPVKLCDAAVAALGPAP
jgi:hypothetical protein